MHGVVFDVLTERKQDAQSVYALRAKPDTLRHHWAWLRHAKPFGEAWWAHKGSNLGPFVVRLPCPIDQRRRGNVSNSP